MSNKQVVLTFIMICLCKNFSYSQVISFDMDRQDTQVLQNLSKKTDNGKIEGNLIYVKDRFDNECRALEFDGNSYISIPHSDKLNLQNFSISVWLKLPAVKFQWLTLICKGETATESENSPAYRVQLTSSTASFNSYSTSIIGNVSQSYPQNSWFHLAAVKEQNLFSVYVNGNLSYQFPANNPIIDNAENINIGRDIVGNTEFFVGIMDEFRLYDEVLSSKEITNLYNEKPKKSGSACAIEQIPPTEIDIDITNTTPEITKPKPNKPANIDINITDTTPEITKPKPNKPADIDINITDTTPEITKPKPNKPADIDINITDTTPEITKPKPNKPDSILIFDGEVVEVGKIVKLNNIQFEQSLADLQDTSYITLNKVVKLLAEKPSIQIELHGHTDNVGNAQKNYQLSIDRVREVKRYLVSKGIHEKRIAVKAFGGEKPIANNNNEKTRKLNRRVEMLIVSQ